MALFQLSSFANRFASAKFPWIKKVPILHYYVIEKYRPHLDNLKNYIVRSVDRALNDYSPDTEPECFVQAYKRSVGKNQYITDIQLLGNCWDFFVAGQETTSTTLRWTMLLMAQNRDIQSKLREEIRSVCGSRLPSMEDKAKMPYASACLLECQRRANVVQMNVIHRTVVDTEVQGHPIPAGSFINGDLHQALLDESIFDEPEVFKPERYLSCDGKTLNKDLVERTIPFSIGKRQCAGESLARIELLLCLCATIQAYELVPTGPIDLKPSRGGIILQPKIQKLALIPV